MPKTRLPYILCLTLNCSHHDPLYKELLHKGVGNQHGNGCDYNQRILHDIRQLEKVVIKMKVNSNASQGDWNEYYFIKYLEEEFNVDFQIEMISDEIWAENFPSLPLSTHNTRLQSWELFPGFHSPTPCG